MTLAIPEGLQQQLLDRAKRRQVSVETLVGEALHWYLDMDPDVLDELDAWGDVRDEALRLAEESSH